MKKNCNVIILRKQKELITNVIKKKESISSKYQCKFFINGGQKRQWDSFISLIKIKNNINNTNKNNIINTKYKYQKSNLNNMIKKS